MKACEQHDTALERRAMRSKASIATAITLALLAGSVATAEAQSWKTINKSRKLRSQEFLDVRIEYAVGRFEVRQGSDNQLYRLDSRYDEDVFNLTTSYLESDRRGRLVIDIDGRNDLDDLDYDHEAGHLRLDLTGETPLSLSMKFGAAEANLDLGGLRLQNLLLETGASDTHVTFSEPNKETAEYCTFKAGAASFKVDDLGNSGCQNISVSGGVGKLALDFSGKWKNDAEADINVGLGTIEISVPAELGVRIDKSTFLMSFKAPGFEKQDGGVWVSRNWDTAKHHLTVSVSGAFGGITVARL